MEMPKIGLNGGILKKLILLSFALFFVNILKPETSEACNKFCSEDHNSAWCDNCKNDQSNKAKVGSY